MNRPSYRRAVEFIALEDSPADRCFEEQLAGNITVALVADLFGKETLEVARAVVRRRQRHHREERAREQETARRLEGGL